MLFWQIFFVVNGQVLNKYSRHLVKLAVWGIFRIGQRPKGNEEASELTFYLSTLTNTFAEVMRHSFLSILIGCARIFNQSECSKQV